MTSKRFPLNTSQFTQLDCFHVTGRTEPVWNEEIAIEYTSEDGINFIQETTRMMFIADQNRYSGELHDDAWLEMVSELLDGEEFSTDATKYPS